MDVGQLVEWELAGDVEILDFFLVPLCPPHVPSDLGENPEPFTPVGIRRLQLST
jgi:hypothetical protein